MSRTVIKFENLSKIYRLGEVGTGTISHDLNRWWKMNILGQPDPYTKIGHTNDRSAKAEKGEMVWALKDIDFEVKEGEVLGIIGKNGAGKSTLLKILSKVTSPTTGCIKVKGRIASLLEVGTGFNPEMTGRENIYMNGTIMGMRKWEIDKKLDEIVDFAGVAKYLDTPVKRYSSGMTVRLGFAVAAHLEPEILVVDEVLAVGDAEFQNRALGKMQEVSKGQGRTVLFVSHNMASIRALCSRGVLLKNGNIYFNGEINTAVSHYLSSDLSLKYEYIWTNDYPQVDENIITGIDIIDEYSNPLNQIFIDQKFFIRIKFKALNQQIGGGFTLVFLDEEGNYIFGSIFNQNESFYGKQLEKGDYISFCEIPSNFLNNRKFNITLLMFPYKYVNPIIIENVLRIELMDSTALRNDFNGKYEGYLRPNLKWKYEKTSKIHNF